jgi:uncharacterized protein (TIGR03083 family)
VTTSKPADFAREYEATRARITALVADLTASDAQGIVPACPDWTVKDLLAHLVGVPSDLVARRNPTEPVQAWVDAQVEARRDVPVAGLLAEWDEVGPTFAGLIERKPALFAGLLYDVVAHEHDLRGALGRPGARDSEALRLSMITECEQLTADLTRLDLPAVLLRAGDDEWIAGSGEPELAIDTELFELFRLLGSRRSVAQMGAAPWEGDLDRFLPALAHMPLPTADLVE